MERVQYSLESSLPELKDLQANGIFSSQEIKEIIKRRSNFEQQLVRRQPRKKDFLEYIEYEMALERLRKKRTERLSEWQVLPNFYSQLRQNRNATAALSI
jgi:U3 small nucleolar RNA-associated protein 6